MDLTNNENFRSVGICVIVSMCVQYIAQCNNFASMFRYEYNYL